MTKMKPGFLIMIGLLLFILGGRWPGYCLVSAGESDGTDQPLVTAIFFESDLR